MSKKPKSALEGLSDMLADSGLANLLGDDSSEAMFSRLEISQIKILPQHRGSDAMDDDEQTIEELSQDVQDQGVLQPIIVCKNVDGPEEHRLIAGERRIRASLMAGKTIIPAMVYGDLTEDQIDRIQYAENVHRLNLRMIEEAKVLERDLKQLGTAEAVAEKRKKSPAWVSKRLALLSLPPQTTRLLTEKVSADLEVISDLRQIEKRSPEAAAKVVDKLKEERGQKGSNARETVKAVKDTVKPPKKPRQEKKPASNPDNVATAKDRSHEAPGPVVDVPPGGAAGTDDAPNNQEGNTDSVSMLDDLNNVFADAKFEDAQTGDTSGDNQTDDEPGSSTAPALPPAAVLDRSYNLIAESGSHPKTVLDVMHADERAECKNWLSSFYEAGTAVKPKMLGREVAKGFRTRTFANEGHGLFALLAFLTGSEDGAVFNLLDIFGAVKP